VKDSKGPGIREKHGGSLQQKIILILILAIILYTGVNVLIQRTIILPNFTRLESDEAVTDIERCVEALRREIRLLDQPCADWATWDDTYKFVEDRNEAYREANLTESSFANNDLSLLAIYDRKGMKVWGRTVDRETQEDMDFRELSGPSLPESHPLLVREKEGTPLGELCVSGVYFTEKGPMLISSRPIITSRYEGPVRGSLMMGRLLVEGDVARLAEQARVNLRAWPIGARNIGAFGRKILIRLTKASPAILDVQSEKLLFAYAAFPDILGRKAVLLRAEVPRKISLRGRAATRAANYSIGAGGAIILAVVLVLTRKMIVRPIARLTDHARTIGRSEDLTLQLAMKRGDEIGVLAREFDTMVAKLGEARKKIADQHYRLGMAELAAGTLHNIGNALTPVVGEVDLLLDDLRRIQMDRIRQAAAEMCGGGDIPSRRREELRQYLDLAHERLSGALEDTKEKLVDISTRTRKIEEILAVQEKLSRSGQPHERVRLHDLVTDAARLLRADVRGRVSIRLDEGIEAMEPVVLARTASTQMLANLLLNAVESIERAGKEGGEIRVYAALVREKDRELVHIKIEDNGAGISGENMARLFQRGFSTKEKKSGMGLHWCANAAEALKGRIYAESEGVGKGACFHLLLPHVQAATKKEVAPGL
jgi:two-component system NtrC family sensor kinase